MKIFGLKNIKSNYISLEKAYIGKKPNGSYFNGANLVIKDNPRELIGITPRGTKFYRCEKPEGELDLYLLTKNNEEIISKKTSQGVSYFKTQDSKIISQKVEGNIPANKNTGLPKFVKKLFSLMNV